MRESPQLRILIAAGGTGGHIYPGIAVANVLKERNPETEILFVGTAKGLETRIVPENGFQLALIHSAGLKNVGLVRKLKGAALLPRSFWEARTLIREFKPDVVVGAGGYVSGPVLLVAHFMGKPTLVMDSNALPGFTNRQLARFVDKAALTFDAAVPFFGPKAVVTGNPVRKEFFDIPIRPPSEKVEVLIFGGSQGARAINDAVIAALPLFAEEKGKLSFTHQTGEAQYEAVRNAYTSEGWDDADVRPYISEMAAAFDRADLIVCRSGATTCAEVCAAGKPAVMIPFPGAADDHQRKNAEALVQKGAARMVIQTELTPERIADEIVSLARDPDTVGKMGAVARSLARADAADATADMIEELAAAGRA
ncbi:MAG: undecaprenyldiphospho-muramoylpentapeptide beta-N-acetylglucosaminyltransferase [Acidobacteria bacterium]|nr:undecaprenyldiphospho-muramoylpentapeptide beta-N-acetylglucosaminyltransferase [Acidobacteriota bacterium]